MTKDLHSTLRVIGVLLAAACLALAYGIAGDWLMLLAIPAMLLFWGVGHARSGFRTASALLAIYVGLAVIGLARHASGLLLAAGCISALAAWDLSDPRSGTSAQARPQRASLLERRHLQSLAAMAGASLLLAALGVTLRLRLPFGIVALLALLLAACVLYAVQYLRKSPRHEHRE